MKVEQQYADSHGQTEVAFAFCRLLGFELMPPGSHSGYRSESAE
jgi:TnpA family transposase